MKQTNLKNSSNKTETWTEVNKIELNIKQCLLDTLAHKWKPSTEIISRMADVAHAKSFKYLAIHPDNKPSWRKQINKNIFQLKTTRMKISWTVSRKFSPSLNKELLTCKAVIITIWTYFFQIWCINTETQIQKIENL